MLLQPFPGVPAEESWSRSIENALLGAAFPLALQAVSNTGTCSRVNLSRQFIQLAFKNCAIMKLIQTISQKGKNFMRGLVQRWGWTGLKGRLWDREFAEGRWDFIEKTPGDPIYQYVEKYCKRGSILDLGCGSGNTGCELDINAYQQYTGLDISEVALNKARQSSVEVHRTGKNRYFQSDILTYVPDQPYDVILFRESIYYIPKGKIKGMLDRYSNFLKPGGVFIVRWHESTAGQQIPHFLDADYSVLDQQLLSPSGPVIIVFNRK